MNPQAIQWIPITEQPMPKGAHIIVKCPFGIEAIVFIDACWWYWYGGSTVRISLINSITHWCKPE